MVPVPPRMRRTCNACRQAKRRCDIPEKPGRCTRCRTRNIPCIFGNSIAGGNWRGGRRIDLIPNVTVEARDEDQEEDDGHEGDNEEVRGQEMPQYEPQLHEGAHDESGMIWQSYNAMPIIDPNLPPSGDLSLDGHGRNLDDYQQSTLTYGNQMPGMYSMSQQRPHPQPSSSWPGIMASDSCDQASTSLTQSQPFVEPTTFAHGSSYYFRPTRSVWPVQTPIWPPDDQIAPLVDRSQPIDPTKSGARTVINPPVEGPVEGIYGHL